MQTFRSTCKLTPEVIREYHHATGKLLDAALTILAILLSASLLLPFVSPYIEHLSRNESRAVFTMAILPFAAVGFLFNLYVLPHIHRTFLRAALRSNEKRFGTPNPTLESHIEDNAVISRCLENGSEDCSPIHGCAAIRTNNHIFLRLSQRHLAVFTISDFSEEVLDDLLSTLSAYGAEIMPNS